MSLAEYNRRIRVVDLSDNDRTWFPRWLDGYVRHHGLDPDAPIDICSPLAVVHGIHGVASLGGIMSMNQRFVKLFGEPCG